MPRAHVAAASKAQAAHAGSARGRHAGQAVFHHQACAGSTPIRSAANRNRSGAGLPRATGWR